ncbi:MAG: ABC transporter permease [Devosia sp.]
MLEFFSQVLNGLIIGNIYAIIAIGFTLIFGVSNLINFAQGSLLMLGGFLAFTLVGVGANIWLAAVCSIIVTMTVGMAIERVALRPLETAPWIAPLLSTLAITFVFDQAAELIWSPEIQPFPSPLSQFVWLVGAAFITGVDIAILAVSLLTVLVLWLFLTRTWSGKAMRAMSQDLDAARQMGIDVDWHRQLAFGIGAALAALAGVLVAMYFQNIFPQMGIPFGLKGFAAALLGGLASVPGAIVGGFALGILESLAVGYVGEGARDMIAFSALLVVLLFRPQGLLGHRRLDALGGVTGASGIMPTTSILAGQGGATRAARRGFELSIPAVAAILVTLAFLPLTGADNYIIQAVLVAVIFATVTISLTVVGGTAGVMFIGFGGFFAVGAYVAAAAAKSWGLSAELAIPLCGLATATLAVLVGLICVPLSGHVIALAALAIGNLIYLVLLNWISVTGGPNGIFGIPRPPLGIGGDLSMNSVPAQYIQALVVLFIVFVVAQRLVKSPIGRTLRAIREDRPAAEAAGIPVRRYLLTAFAFAGFGAGVAGSLYTFLHRFISPDSFRLDTSFLLVAAAVLGGLGNVTGAMIAGAAIVILPELLREFADYRMVVFGLLLLAALRFRPEGLAGVR